jgi:hypothetical protein
MKNWYKHPMIIWGKQGDVPKKLFTYLQQEQMFLILVLGMLP